ncbi:hypothetical protein NE237_030762 [Protea cynaroides]|uniref:Uncharacterized protein n=1 Tax=Protea cynaroides TaxID=273540 RepID=A0A9Q0JXA4_9MAGN|nr:hypothetical protein NE237_030762 [Protea cynaroides]
MWHPFPPSWFAYLQLFSFLPSFCEQPSPGPQPLWVFPGGPLVPPQPDGLIHALIQASPAPPPPLGLVSSTSTPLVDHSKASTPSAPFSEPFFYPRIRFQFGSCKSARPSIPSCPLALADIYGFNILGPPNPRPLYHSSPAFLHGEIKAIDPSPLAPSSEEV